MSMTYTCDWCAQENLPLTQKEEQEHLYNCDAFQGQTTAEIHNGKEFVRLPGHAHILIERFPRRLN